MADTLADVMSAVKTSLAGVTGVLSTSQYPQDKPYSGLAVEVRPMSGREGNDAAGGVTMLHTISVDLYKPAGELNKDMAILVPLIESVCKALTGNVTMTGNAQTFGGWNYTYFFEDWAGVQVRGFRWTLTDIKIQATL